MSGTYQCKNLNISFDSAYWEPVENHMGSLVTFFLTEKGKAAYRMEGFQPCVSVSLYENIKLGIEQLFHNTCRDLKKYMQHLELITEDLQENACDFVYRGMNSNHTITCRQIIRKNDGDVLSVTGGCDSEKFPSFQACMEALCEGIVFE